MEKNESKGVQEVILFLNLRRSSKSRHERAVAPLRDQQIPLQQTLARGLELKEENNIDFCGIVACKKHCNTAVGAGARKGT
jgi:hypothetical protein